MTIAALGLGAVLAALGTRLAAVAFIVAAATAAMKDGALATVGTWTAALAAGIVLLDAVPLRRLALPAAGATAVVAAGSAVNGAVVCGLWLAAAAALALFVRDDDRWRHVVIGLLAADLLLAAGVATTAGGGYQGWPATLGTPGAALLLASVCLRIPALTTPAPDAPIGVGALLVVRAQMAVLLIAAVSGAGAVAEVTLVAGAAAFALAPLGSRREVADTIQEVGLVAAVASAGALGWVAQGWVWGALAAGTLTHQLRFMVGRGTAGSWPDAILRAGGLGLPFLPVVGALLEGSTVVRGWRAAVLALALVAGLAGRTRLPAPPRSRRASRRGTILDGVRVAGVIATAAVAGLWSGALSLPRPPAADAIAWPAAWAAAAVAVVAAGGSRLSLGWVPKAGPVPALDPRVQAAARWVAGLHVPSGARVLWAALGVSAAASAALWIAGLARGFL